MRLRAGVPWWGLAAQDKETTLMTPADMYRDTKANLERRYSNPQAKRRGTIASALVLVAIVALLECIFSVLYSMSTSTIPDVTNVIVALTIMVITGVVGSLLADQAANIQDNEDEMAAAAEAKAARRETARTSRGGKRR
jgi:hypothetical protein